MGGYLGGYYGLALVGGIVFRLSPEAGRWLYSLLLAFPPALIMCGAAYLLKDRTMMISSLITLGVALLSCGTCYALSIG